MLLAICALLPRAFESSCSSFTSCAESWSSTHITWAPIPRLMFRGERPDRKSLIWTSVKLSNTSITVLSALAVEHSKPASMTGTRVSLLPSVTPWSRSVPAVRCLSLCRSTILSVCSLSFWEMRAFRASTVSPRGTVSSTGLPAVEVMHRRMEGWPLETPAPRLAHWKAVTLQRPRCCCSIHEHWLL